MKFVNRRGYRNIIIIILVIAFIYGGLSISLVLLEPYAHIAPDYPKINISSILAKRELSQEDYQTLYYQTGLGKPAIDDLRTLYPDSANRILNFQQKFFESIKYVHERNSPISWEESAVDENGKYIAATDMAPLRNGYILITKSSYTYGWRNGHAALVVDAENGTTLESVVLGTNSTFQDISKWTNYPNFMLLRLKNAPPELLDEIAQSAVKNLNNIPYDLFAGIFNSKFKKPGKIDGTQCSHLVWEAFRLFGFDLDSDGGGLVTPNDIANSPLLEVVQVYGVDPDNIWP